MFVDHAEIHVKAGKGGDGCLSFRREKYIARGGPDGGDGGDGGGVFAVADPNIETLLDFSGKHHWKGGKGQPGMGKKRFGRHGIDAVLNLPLGTLLYDRETNLLIKDLSEPGKRICVARGGRGGKGNARFATATNRVPYEWEPGEPGEERSLRLELKLFADVGVVGLPNAGKSTLLSRLSKAKPKIAAYPFTTLQPQLGIVTLSGNRRFVMADIPGLIEGANTGAGLGDEFLKHIERTRTILHVVDVGGETTSPARDYEIIRNELARYSQHLASKQELVVASKIDLTGAEENASQLQDAIGGEVMAISSITGVGLNAIAERLWSILDRSKTTTAQPTLELPPVPPHKRFHDDSNSSD